MTALLDDARVSIDIEQGQEVNDFIDMEQVTADVKVDPNNIENSLLSMASIYARYGLLVAKARIQRDGYKSRRGLIAAKLEKAIRDQAIEDEVKMTNPQVAAAVDRHPQMVSAELNLNEASAVLAACQETLSAVSMKRDMLVQLNKNRQNEWNASSGRVPGDKPVANGSGSSPKPAVQDIDLSDVI